MFVVDGYNAIRRIARFARIEARDGLEAGRKALVTAIVSSGVLNAHRVVVIFDGSDDVPSAERSPHRSLTLRYSKPPDDADRTIVSYVESKGEGVETVVITADADLRLSVARLGATVLAPEGWPPLSLPKRRKRPRDSLSTEKPRATSADVAYWLEIFEEDD